MKKFKRSLLRKYVRTTFGTSTEVNVAKDFDNITFYIKNSKQCRKVNISYQTLKDKMFLAAKDIAIALGLTNATAMCKYYDIPTEEITVQTKGGKQKKKFIKEQYFYEIIKRTYKTKSRFFKKWYFKNVLPNLNKDGSFNYRYKTREEMFNIEQFSPYTT